MPAGLLAELVAALCHAERDVPAVSIAPRCAAGEQVMHSSKVYTKLNERLGLHDHLTGEGVGGW